MKAFIKILVLVALIWFWGSANVYGHVDFTIVDTWDLGNKIVGGGYHMGANRYMSFQMHCVEVFECTATSVEKVQSLYSSELSSAWYGVSIDSNRVYVATHNADIMVYEILADYTLLYLGEIPLMPGLGAINETILLWVHGNTMVVSVYSTTMESSDNAVGYYDVYDITNFQTPVFLARNIFPRLQVLTNIHAVDGGYYLVGIEDAVYFTPDLLTFDGLNLLPDSSSNRLIRNSFVHMGKLYIMKQESFMQLRSYSFEPDHRLSLDWDVNLPLMSIGYQHYLDQDRLFIIGFDSNNNGILYSLYTSEENCVLDTVLPFSGRRIHPLDGGYLALGISSAAFYDADLNLQYTIYEDPVWKAVALIANRWAVLVENGPFGNQPLHFYDLENRQWLDYVGVKDVLFTSTRHDSNVLCIPNANQAKLLRFLDDGTCQESVFYMSNRCYGMDVWEDRMAITHVTGSQYTLKVYDISSGVPVLIGSRPMGSEITYDMRFYGPDHIVISKNMYMEPELLFFKIEQDGLITSLATINVGNYEHLHVEDGTIVTGRAGAAVIDTSDPDDPYIRTYTYPMSPSGWGSGIISSDGGNSYLFSCDVLWISYTTDANFQMRGWYYSGVSWYKGPNRILLQNYHSFLEVEHAPYTSIDDPTVPQVSNLLGLPYPNPSRDRVKIDFEFKESSKGKADVYNVRGQKVRSLDTIQYPKGKHTLEWDGFDERGQKVSAGIYLLRFETQGRSYVRRMVRMK